MNISTATPEDNDYITNAGDAILQYHQAFNTFYEPVGEKAVEATKQEKIALVAEEDGKRIGFISGCITYMPVDRSESFAMLRAVWVEETYRGQGVACQLVEAFEALVKKKGVNRVELFVDLQNELGKQLWDAQEYVTYQERRFKELT